MNKQSYNWSLLLIVLVTTVIAEMIGAVSLTLGQITVVLAPLIWAMLLSLIIFLIPSVNLTTEGNVKQANYMMGIALALLMAKLGVSSGSQLEEIRQAGVALVLQNFGNIGTIFFALPIALLLGLKRESIGMSHALSREANVGLIQETYGATSAEFRGVMTVYIVGTLLGPIVIGLLASIGTTLGLVSPQAAAMGAGAGSASMMSAGLASLIEMYPEYTDQLTAYAGLSNLISSVIALPLGIFLGLPITERLYRWLNPIFGREKKEAHHEQI